MNSADDGSIKKKCSNMGCCKMSKLKILDEYITVIEEFHVFTVKNKMKFLTYLLEMACMESVNIKLLENSKNQCAPANQKASHY